MRIRLSNLMAGLLLSVYAFAAGGAIDSRPAILVMGDSLSAGFGIDLQDTWIALLQSRLDAEGYGYRVVNASISGATTSNGLRSLPRALDIHQPEVLIIELGGNDGLRGLPPAVMRDNLAAMITAAQDAGAQVILAGMLIPPNYGVNYTSEFEAVFTTLAIEYDTPLIPFFMEGVALEPSKMQADGIHPNKDAQPILLETVWKTLGPLLASARTS